jgi:Alpha amylase, catalytic domain
MGPQNPEPGSPGPRHSLWYKDAIVYELHVRTFHDSHGDGIGDFAGLTEKLDYVQDLGVTVIWLLPLYPSPLRDDGYDIAHYMDVHPDCGTLRDFKIFLRESHRRGLRVITSLSSTTPRISTRGFSAPDERRPGAPLATFTSGAIPRNSTKKRGSSSEILILQLDLGFGRMRLLLVPVLFAPTRS